MPKKSTAVIPKIFTIKHRYYMERKLLTSKEAAKYLGISLSFLRKMMMKPHHPHVQAKRQTLLF